MIPFTKSAGNISDRWWDENVSSMMSRARGQSGTSSLPIFLLSLYGAVMQTIQIYVLDKLNGLFYPMSMK